MIGFNVVLHIKSISSIHNCFSSVAKRKSLFDDKPEEIQQLTFIVKQDIASLNKQILQLQSLCKSQAGRYGKHKQGHASSVVVGLQQKLAVMSNDFKGVLEVRTEVSTVSVLHSLMLV